jgi:hypothetical protein
MSLFCLGEIDFIEKRVVSDMNRGEQQHVSGEKEQGQNGDMDLCLQALNHEEVFFRGNHQEGLLFEDVFKYGTLCRVSRCST